MNCKCSENKGPSPLKIVVPCPLYQAQQESEKDTSSVILNLILGYS